MASAGRSFGDADVAAVYLVHGTFCGNDPLGVLTELSRRAPATAERLRRWLKAAVDAIIGETGNYTAAFAERMEKGLAVGAGRPLPVRLFNWSSQNNHIARADGAVRLIDELARFAEAGGPTGDSDSLPSRIQIWTHSHGGNVLALVTNLLGSDPGDRADFFHAARTFYHRRSGAVDMPAWERVENLLHDAGHPLRRFALDIVNYGMPIRYGWETAGFGKLLHITHHRPIVKRPAYLAPWPPRLHRIIRGTDGDFIQQLGIAGTNLAPLPLAVRTFLADWRLDRYLERELTPRWLLQRLPLGMRVPEDGATLLVDYADPDRFLLRHLAGHAPYTRSRWLPLHCELVAQELYGRST